MNERSIRRFGRVGLAVAAWLGVLAAAGPAGAAVPQAVMHQGRLYDVDGLPVNGVLSVAFAIYDAVDAGAAIWGETHAIDFVDGYYSVELGTEMPLDDVVFDGSVRWLGVAVGTDDEMQPRAAVNSVPYAI